MEQDGTQYQILERIDVGGMAEIFRAQNLGTDEIVAIKRILPALGQQPEFVDMFVDEAVICMALKHPNIVRVHQLGVMDGDLFLAMEYVAGVNLRDLLNYASSNNYVIPTYEAVLIAINILDGLEYAHHCKDSSGEPLHIIHRDVSPPNILLGYNGDVKITDFGLVKAKTQMTRTVPGLIKGKFSYLSPEAAYGESIDPRSDLYAVGIILWEMLTRRPLFTDPVEVKILDLVRRSEIPPISPINPDVTPNLEAIVRKGLSRNRDERYQSAAEFADDLRTFYKSLGSPKSKLGQLVARVRPPKPEDTAKVQKGASTVSQLIPIKEFEDAMAAELEAQQLNELAEPDFIPEPMTKKVEEPIVKEQREKRPVRREKEEEESNKPLYIAIVLLAFVVGSLLIAMVAFGL